MTSAQVVEKSVNVISNSPFQDYTHPDDRTFLNDEMTPGFKPFAMISFRISFATKYLLQLIIKVSKIDCKHAGNCLMNPGGGTPLFGLYGYVPLDRVWFFSLAVLNRVYNLTCLCPKQV